MHSATAEFGHHPEKCHVEVAHYHLVIAFSHQMGKVRPERAQPPRPVVIGEQAVQMHNHDVVRVAQETYVAVGLDSRDEHSRVGDSPHRCHFFVCRYRLAADPNARARWDCKSALAAL